MALLSYWSNRRRDNRRGRLLALDDLGEITLGLNQGWSAHRIRLRGKGFSAWHSLTGKLLKWWNIRRWNNQQGCRLQLDDLGEITFGTNQVWSTHRIYGRSFGSWHSLFTGKLLQLVGLDWDKLLLWGKLSR